MLRATIDLIGMYTYDNTLLDNMVIPQAINKEDLKDNLLMEAAELELLYSDPNFLKMAIGAWSRKQLPVWMQLWDTTQYEYNPIWNKDGKISDVRDFKATENVIENVDRVDNLTDKTTKNLTDVRNTNFEDKTKSEYKNTTDRKSNDTETRNLQDEALNSVYGFNSSSDVPANKDVTKATGTDKMDRTGTDVISHDAKDTINRTGTDTISTTGTDTIDHTGHQDIDRKINRDSTDKGTITRIEQGNIGVTSTQSLIKEQREVVDYNVMDIIIHDFINRFCLKVY